MAVRIDISDFERITYYHGISADPPELLYRSDWLDNPYPLPTGRFQHVPTKTIHGVFNTPLNSVWHRIARRIQSELNFFDVRYSGIHAARFLTHGEDGKPDVLGPPVIWIATPPGSTTVEAAYRRSRRILEYLEAIEVEGVVVEWFEASVEELSGPPLLRVVQDTDPTFHVRRFLTPAPGMPIVAAEREAEDAQGAVAFFFHETKDRDGNLSKRVLGVSNCHALRKDTSVAYELKGNGAPPPHVRLAGPRRFHRGLDDIKAAVAGHDITAELLAREIAVLEKTLATEDAEAACEAQEEVDEAREALVAKRAQLTKTESDIAVLEAFHKDVNDQWGDIASRTIGHVDWAPAISVDSHIKITIDPMDVGYSTHEELGTCYKNDIGTFEVDAERFRAHYKGNVVDLGAKYTSWQLAEKFNPRRNNGTSTPAGTAFQFPTNRQLRINGVLTRDELLAGTRDTVDSHGAGDTVDSHGDPTMVVMKVGGTTDLTVGRFAGLEAYICDAAGVESVALAIYNYEISPAGPASASAASTKGASRIFAAKGDSGSLVFNGEGRMVGILHSGLVGMARVRKGRSKGGSTHGLTEGGSSHAESGSSHAESSSSHAESGRSHAESSSSHPTKARTSHISYATPAWWAIEQIRAQYPHAEFDRERF
ncbi:hypothetical protein BD626DRAFT_633163 [Schizophyllum amplum]|uniref:Uncharacterized protein n=1 Tax=Schizophyllum amplum TaxID=97359 RepID=A0A550C4G5_9AGAR|nr:hypothetical protein BD626DRAFT_633163 [Auriculariopsis ampla]